ncbi:hypothetical protein TURU_162075 [Turdus rufiventris]|nr:hypothetical protein TURU_162075 [Turdus rufiventris]
MASLYQRFSGKINTSRSFPVPPEASHLLGAQSSEEDGAAGKTPRPLQQEGSRPRFQYQSRSDCEEEDKELSEVPNPPVPGQKELSELPNPSVSGQKELSEVPNPSVPGQKDLSELPNPSCPGSEGPVRAAEPLCPGSEGAVRVAEPLLSRVRRSCPSCRTPPVLDQKDLSEVPNPSVLGQKELSGLPNPSCPGSEGAVRGSEPLYPG